MNIELDIRWHFRANESEEIPSEIFDLLRAISDGGSLRNAASDCNLSYRHAWGLLQKWDQTMGSPLASLQRGKGARLTPLGERLLGQYKRINARMAPELERLASELSVDLAQIVGSKVLPQLKIMASHGLAIALLRDLAQESQELDLDLQFSGSLESLRALKAGHADVAGFHLPEGDLGRTLAPKFRRFLDPKTNALIYAVRRCQGLMTATDSPLKINSLKDIVNRKVRFVNRQANSGTRATLDLLLEREQIDRNDVQGYGDEEFTHLAVAAMVASGAADVAFGIEAAARQFDLNFIPINWESYWFAVRRDDMHSPAMDSFISTLRSAAFKQQIEKFRGYGSSRAGTVVLPKCGDEMTEMIV